MNFTPETSQQYQKKAAAARAKTMKLLKLSDGKKPQSLQEQLRWLDEIATARDWKEASGIIRARIRAMRLDETLHEVYHRR